MNFEATGTIVEIGETKEIGQNNFKKRQVIIKTHEGEHSQTLPFDLLKDRCSLLDNFEPGQDVKISFNLRGSQSGERYFNNVVAWKIEALE